MGYVHRMQANVSLAAWTECYFALLSLKAHLQSVPGWQHMEIWANDTDESVDVSVETIWEQLGEVSVWMEHGTTPDSLIRSIEPGAPLEVRLDARL